ncbi:Nn.00g104970.m01.CDS01 [Neocucurbitaria sp. VM-36]
MKPQILTIGALAVLVNAQGTGPYPASYIIDTGLTRHTVYAPTTPPTNLTLPVVIWGEGGCIASGTSAQEFLTEIASHGFYIIASGKPNGSGTTTSAYMKEAIDYITLNAGHGMYGNVNASRIATAGYSCGGLEAYELAQDARVSAIGIFNSGQLDAAASNNVAGNLTKPVFYFLGGSSDIAYANGERDYAALPVGTPSWKGNLNVGHRGTYNDTNGGKFAIGATKYFDWVLRGNTTAGQYFLNGNAESDGFATAMKSLENIIVTPI